MAQALEGERSNGLIQIYLKIPPNSKYRQPPPRATGRLARNGCNADILSAAQYVQCHGLWSEDLNPGQLYATVLPNAEAAR
jgi:hypothetical protein